MASPHKSRSAEGQSGRTVQGRAEGRAASRAATVPHAPHPSSLLLRAAGGAGRLTATEALQLQRAVGNGATARLLGAGRGAGRPLDRDTRARMETHFGTGFGGVRVHDDARADALNRAIDARAFASGRDIFFRKGEYDPASAKGRELLGHELTHVVQQRQGRAKSHWQAKGLGGGASSELEREADRQGARAARPVGAAVERAPVVNFQTPPPASLIRQAFARPKADAPNGPRRGGARSTAGRAAPQTPRRRVNLGGETHTLYYEEHGGKIDIMLATTPKLLAGLLQGVRPDRNGNALEKLKFEVDLFDQASSGWNREFGKALVHHLDELQGVLANTQNLPAELGTRPRTQIQWDAAVQGAYSQDQIQRTISRGTRVRANPLSLNPPAGGGVFGQQPGEAPNYPGILADNVKGHLLNHHLYGPATDENLVPMSRGMNKEFSGNFEEKVKQAVMMQNRVVSLEVTAPRENIPNTNIASAVPSQIRAVVVERTADGQGDKPGGWQADYTFYQNAPHTVKNSEVNPPQPEQNQNRLAPLETVFRGLGTERATLEAAQQQAQQQQTQFPDDDAQRLLKIQTAEQARSLSPTWTLLDMAFGGREEWGPAYSNYLAKLLENIQTLLPAASQLRGQQTRRAALQIPQSYRATVVNYGPELRFHLTGEDKQYTSGTGMDANPLTINPGANRGTEPEEAVGLGADYIQGHLLNHHLHGPGVAKNLVPMLRTINSVMEGEIESEAKEAVIGRGKEVRYRAEVLSYTNDHGLPNLEVTKDDHDDNKNIPGYPGQTYADNDFVASDSDMDDEPRQPAILPEKIKWTLSVPNKRDVAREYNVLRRVVREGSSSEAKRRAMEDEDFGPSQTKTKRRKKKP